MALDNLISIEFTQEELSKINNALNEISTVLKGKAINLSPDERKQYGSIADRNKVFVDKCKTYMEQDPTSIPRTLDKDEFDKDYKARQQMEEPLKRLAKVTEMLSDTKILLDFDNYNAAISYYRYVKFLASENEAGSTTVYEDLKSHFSSGKTTPADTTEVEAKPTTPTA